MHSQTTRLVDSASWCDRVRARRGSHPLRRPFPGTWARSTAEDASLRRDIRVRESFCVFTTKWAPLRRTRTANGGATTDGHLLIPIPWRNSRRGLFVLPRGHGFPCHRDREGTGRYEATTPPPVDV
ncbi:hypothetical protein V6N13_037273 [Hibiscus sabdariffa]